MASRSAAGVWCAAHRRALRSDARVHRPPGATRPAHRAPPAHHPPGRRRAPHSAARTRVPARRRARPGFERRSPPPNARDPRRAVAATPSRRRRARSLQRLLGLRRCAQRRGGTRSLAAAARVVPPRGCAGRQDRSGECSQSHRQTTQCGAGRSRPRGRGRRCHHAVQSRRGHQRERRPRSRGQWRATSPRRG